jgi:hypothetical protein
MWALLVLVNEICPLCAFLAVHIGLFPPFHLYLPMWKLTLYSTLMHAPYRLTKLVTLATHAAFVGRLSL